MRGFVDLHCHWVSGIDDGARSIEESRALLAGLHAAGFDRVIATPHMRPGMFENQKGDLERAYAATERALEGQDGLPERGLASEHFFDDVVFQRLMGGQGCPYPGGRAALVEFPVRNLPALVTHRLSDLLRRGIRPVLAHPERYEPVWKDIGCLDPIVDGGTVLLLDVAALAGKYGRKPQKTAEELLDAGYYYAACSDAHSPRDVPEVARGITLLFERMGAEEAAFLLGEGPRSILEGRVNI